MWGEGRVHEWDMCRVRVGEKGCLCNPGVRRIRCPDVWRNFLGCTVRMGLIYRLRRYIARTCRVARVFP